MILATWGRLIHYDECKWYHAIRPTKPTDSTSRILVQSQIRQSRFAPFQVETSWLKCQVEWELQFLCQDLPAPDEDRLPKKSTRWTWLISVFFHSWFPCRKYLGLCMYQQQKEIQLCSRNKTQQQRKRYSTFCHEIIEVTSESIHRT